MGSRRIRSCSIRRLGCRRRRGSKRLGGNGLCGRATRWALTENSTVGGRTQAQLAAQLIRPTLTPASEVPILSDRMRSQVWVNGTRMMLFSAVVPPNKRGNRTSRRPTADRLYPVQYTVTNKHITGIISVTSIYYHSLVPRFDNSLALTVRVQRDDIIAVYMHKNII